MQQLTLKRPARRGCDATTKTCKSGLETLTLWFADLKGRKERKTERGREVERESNCFRGGQEV